MAETNESLTYSMNPYQGEYSENAANRFENLEGIEGKILNHFLYSKTRHAENFWKILKYNTPDALNKDGLTPEEKYELVFFNDDGGTYTTKRFFVQPFVDDAWSEQCSSVYVYVDEIHPTDHIRANIIVTVEVVVHARISTMDGNREQELLPLMSGRVDLENSKFYVPYYDNRDKAWKEKEIAPDNKHSYFDLPSKIFYNWFGAEGFKKIEQEGYASTQYNPNDFDKQGNIVVAKKNRATVLLKSIIAELNGLYLDGIGNLMIDPTLDKDTGAKLSLWNSRSFYGYTIKFATKMGNYSDKPDFGF